MTSRPRPAFPLRSKSLRMPLRAMQAGWLKRRTRGSKLELLKAFLTLSDRCERNGRGLPKKLQPKLIRRWVPDGTAWMR